jgi:uncharacterized protein (UPF0297 family)
MFQINYQQILLDLEEEIQQQQKETEKEVKSSLEREGLGQQWKTEHGLILWKDCVYILDSKSLREEIIKRHHDQPLAGHARYMKTHKLITRNYWWPRMMEDIKEYVKHVKKRKLISKKEQHH